MKRMRWVVRITVAVAALVLILIGPLLAGDAALAKETWRRWLAYPYSSLIHQGSPAGTSTGGVMAFTSSVNFYEVPSVSSCGFGGPGGCFSPLVDYNEDGKEIWGWAQASFQMNGQYACAQFNPNYGSFGIELYIDGISSGYQSYSGTGGDSQSRCTVTRSPGYHTVTIRWAGGYLQNGWVYGAGDTTLPVTTASHVGGSGTSATVTSAATDNSGLINHHWCRVNGGAWKDTRTSACSINVDIATHGSSISFQSYAQDYVGNTSAVQTYAFTLDNTPPAMSAAVEQNGMPGGVWDNLSNTPSYTWSATDSESGVRGFYIYFGPDPSGTVSTIYETTGFVAGSAWSPGAVTAGQYYLRVKAEDWGGNQTAWVTMHQYWYDGTPPVLSAATEQNGMPDGAWSNISADPTYTWDATDNASGVHGFYIYFGTDPNGTNTTIETTTGYTIGAPWTSGTISEGQYYLRVSAEDWAGNQTAWTEMHQYWYDSTPPVLSAATEQNGMPEGAWSNISADPIYTWDATDDVSGVRGFYIYFGTDPNGTNTTIETTTGYTIGSPWTSGPVSDGQYYLRVCAEDWTGNQTAWTDMHQYWYDGTPPDVSSQIPNPESTGWFTSPTEMIVSGSDNIGIQSVEIDVGDGKGWVSSSQVVLTDGEWTVLYRTFDLAGNTATGTISFNIDTTDPASAFIAGQDNAEIIGQGLLVLKGSSADNLSGVGHIEMSLNGGATWFQLGPQLDWQYEWDTSLVPDGLYHVMVRSQDVAGNQENTAHVYVAVRNATPFFELENFRIWEEGDLRILSGHPDLLALMSKNNTALPEVTEVQIKVWDYKWRWGERIIYESKDGTYPEKLVWDRVFVYDNKGDPVVFAPSGENYPVTVWAKNSYGRENTHTAEIIIPYVPPVNPPPASAPNLSPPEVSLTPYWKLWEAGALAISPGSGEVNKVTIEIYDLQGRWDPLLWEFGGFDWPPLISWDGHRRFGDGILAPPGQYDVRVTAFASDGQVGTAYGIIDIPAPVEAAPVAAAPVERPDDPPPASIVIPTLIAPIVIPPWFYLPLLAFLGVLAAFSITYAADPRPRQARELHQTIEAARAWSDLARAAQ